MSHSPNLLRHALPTIPRAHPDRGAGRPSAQTLTVLAHPANTTRERARIAAVAFALAIAVAIAVAVTLAALAALCRTHGARLLLDPSVVSVFTVDVLAHTDVVVSSLTKYTGSAGDLTAGLIAVNPARPDAEALLQSARSYIDAPYAADTIALAQQIVKLPAVTARLSQQATELAQRLAQHPAVSRVRTALTTSTAKNYQAMLRPGAGPGALITLELKADLRTVYDRLQVVKGPSFGLEFTLATPFLWLAHFSEVTTPEGREGLRRAGLDPDLLRVSVGLEPIEEIWSAFAAALKK